MILVVRKACGVFLIGSYFLPTNNHKDTPLAAIHLNQTDTTHDYTHQDNSDNQEDNDSPPPDSKHHSEVALHCKRRSSH